MNELDEMYEAEELRDRQKHDDKVREVEHKSVYFGIEIGESDEDLSAEWVETEE